MFAYLHSWKTAHGQELACLLNVIIVSNSNVIMNVIILSMTSFFIP